MHRELFYQIMDRATCNDSVLQFGLNNYFCTKGHDLTKLAVYRFFNCVAKNLVRDMTNRAYQTAPCPLPKRRKIDKLCSNSQ